MKINSLILDNWIKVSAKILFSGIAAIGILGYFYLAFRGLYRNQEKRWCVGLLAFGFPFVALTSGLITWMLWNPLVVRIFWPLLIFILFIGVLLSQSITSPYNLVDWWTEFGKRISHRKLKH